MRNKFIKLAFVLLIIAAGVFFWLRLNSKNTPDEVIKEITPFRGMIKSVISTTGTVLPKNRLAIRPPVNGRAEEILVKEGDKVKTGQILVWMSSTDRAALIDAARGKSGESLAYWEDAYKPIQLISPIDAEVIVATTQPGQTITTADSVIVLSDHLIVRGQVDETDIGKISEGQAAVVTLDAYPDKKITARVEHIYYESQTVNNVTIYNVDVIPDEVPPFFRSGMNATVDFKQESPDNLILLPQEAVEKDKEGSWVLVKQPGGKEPRKEKVVTGLADDKNIEIRSGLRDDDVVIVKSKKYALPKAGGGSNPFMPGRRR